MEIIMKKTIANKNLIVLLMLATLIVAVSSISSVWARYTYSSDVGTLSLSIVPKSSKLSTVINGETVYFEEDMTWADWLNSEYNTKNYMNPAGTQFIGWYEGGKRYILVDNDSNYGAYPYNPFLLNEKIIPDKEYGTMVG